jgi:hypothetical protein
MSFRTTYILFGLLGVMLVALLIALFKGEAKEPGPYLLAGFNDEKGSAKVEEIDKVEIDRSRPESKAGRIVLERVGEDRWTVNGRRAARGAVEDLLRQLRAARREKVQATEKLSEWGLEPPAAVVKLYREDGPPIELRLGDESPGADPIVYALDPSRPKDPTAVRRFSVDRLLAAAKSFRDPTLIHSAPTDVQSVQLSEPGKPTVALSKGKGGDWEYTKPFSGDAYLSGAGVAAEGKPPADVRGLLTDLTNMRVDYDEGRADDFVADDVSDADLVKYGLRAAKEGDKLDLLEVTVGLADGKSVTLLVNVAKEAEEKKEEKKDDKDKQPPEPKTLKYYCMRKGERSVYRVAVRAVTPLRKLLDEPEAMRDRHLVRRQEADKEPDVVRVTRVLGDGKKQEIDFFRAGPFGPWRMFVGDKEEKLDQSALLPPAGLLSTLTADKLIDGFVDDLSKLSPEEKKSLDAPDYVIELWTDGIAPDKPAEKKEEKKDDKKDEKKEDKKDEKKRPQIKEPGKPTVKVSIGKKAGSLVLAKREAGGKTLVARVKDVVLERVSDGPIAFLDKSLPRFDEVPSAKTVLVTGLLVKRDDGVVYEMKRDKEESPWKLVQPKSSEGKDAVASAVRVAVSALNNLHAEKLITDRADDLKTYGLDRPTARAEVTFKKDGKDEAWVYEFGKDYDAGTRYAKIAGKPLVFTVLKADLTPLFGREFRDLTLVKFDPSKARSLKLVGWKVPVTLELEKKDGKWVNKQSGGQAPEPDKVTAFLGQLANLQGTRIVSDKPDAAQEFATAKGGLQVEVTVEGEAKPVKLFVGKSDADGTLVTTDPEAGTVYAVSKSIFEGPDGKGLKNDVSYFFGR